MTLMALVTGYGPYYIVGFIITFFTLMSCRYTLGYDIHPQEKFIRIMMVSLFWFLSLVICAMIAYFKRGNDSTESKNEADQLRAELAELQAQLQHTKQADKPASDESLAPAQKFSNTETVVTSNNTAQDKSMDKKRFTW